MTDALYAEARILTADRIIRTDNGGRVYIDIPPTMVDALIEAANDPTRTLAIETVIGFIDPQVRDDVRIEMDRGPSNTAGQPANEEWNGCPRCGNWHAKFNDEKCLACAAGDGDLGPDVQERVRSASARVAELFGWGDEVETPDDPDRLYAAVYDHESGTQWLYDTNLQELVERVCWADDSLYYGIWDQEFYTAIDGRWVELPDGAIEPIVRNWEAKRDAEREAAPVKPYRVIVHGPRDLSDLHSAHRTREDAQKVVDELPKILRAKIVERRK